jgi:hypothetical protein
VCGDGDKSAARSTRASSVVGALECAVRAVLRLLRMYVVRQLLLATLLEEKQL